MGMRMQFGGLRTGSLDQRAGALCPQGPARKIFIEFLERSCTAEFSGFLLYKELGRRLKKTNPVVAEVLATDTCP